MAHERRLGERVSLREDVEVRWTPSAAARSGRLGGRGTGRGRTRTAYLRSVSMSGAGLIVPASGDLALGRAVHVHVAGEWEFAGRVRRTVPTVQPEWTYCGVEYVHVSPAYQAWLDDMLDRRRPHVPGDEWRAGR